MTKLALHQQRVVAERDELAERLSKLFAFFSSPAFAALPATEQTRLRSQARFMDGYLLVLNERIEAFWAPQAADLDAFMGLTLDQVKERLAVLGADDLRGLVVSLLIQQRIAERAFAATQPA